MRVLDPGTNRLPAPPDVELALYRRLGRRNDPITDVSRTPPLEGCHLTAMNTPIVFADQRYQSARWSAVEDGGGEPFSAREECVT
jgi:hypothetical protein